MHRYAAFAIGVLRDIYAFHRYTTHSAYLSHTLDPQFQRLDEVEPPVGKTVSYTHLTLPTT